MPKNYHFDKFRFIQDKKGKKMSNDLHRWKKEASKIDWLLLAQFSGTSAGYLNQIAYGNRRPSPELAEEIEKATNKFSNIKPVEKERLIFAQTRSSMI